MYVYAITKKKTPQQKNESSTICLMCSTSRMKCFSNDVMERLKVGILIIIEMCRVSMGCFTSVFVTHACKETENDDNCSYMYAWTPETELGKITLGFNAVTCLLFMGLYAIEVYRENWLIEYLDSNDTIPTVNLSTAIPFHLNKQLSKINMLYWHTTWCTLVIFLVNFVVSAKFLSKTFTTLSTLSAFTGFTILLGQKIYYAASIAYAGRSGYVAQSAFLTIPYTYNTIDEDHVGEDPGRRIASSKWKNKMKNTKVVPV